MSLQAFNFGAWGGIFMPGMDLEGEINDPPVIQDHTEENAKELHNSTLDSRTLKNRTRPGEPAGEPSSENNDTANRPHDGHNGPTNNSHSGNNGQSSGTGNKSNRLQVSGPPQLKFPIPDSKGMKKKRMNLKWFQQFDKLYDPDPEDCFYTMMFGKTSDGSWDPDLLDKGADARFSDYAAGVGALALKARAITQKDAARYVAVWNTEGRFISYRKHEGQAFLGPDRKPLVINGEPMCGGEPQWKGQESIWSLEGVHRCADYEPWLRLTLFHEKPKVLVDDIKGNGKEMTKTQTPALDMVPRALQKQIMKENLELKDKMADMLRTYQLLVESEKSLRAATEIIEKDRRNLTHQRINGIQDNITKMEKDIMEVTEAFENASVGNGIAALERIIGSLRKVTKACENKSAEFQKKMFITSSSSDEDEDDDGERDGAGNGGESNRVNNHDISKKRARSPMSQGTTTKTKKVTEHSSPSNSRHMPQQNLQLSDFLQSGMSLEDFFASPETVFESPPKNAAEYIRKDRNPVDKIQFLAMTSLPPVKNMPGKKQVRKKQGRNMQNTGSRRNNNQRSGVFSKMVAARIEEIEESRIAALAGEMQVSDEEFDRFGQRKWLDLNARSTYTQNPKDFDYDDPLKLQVQTTLDSLDELEDGDEMVNQVKRVSRGQKVQAVDDDQDTALN